MTLTQGSSHLLAILRDNGPKLAYGELVRLSGLSGHDLYQYLDPLVDRGLIHAYGKSVELVSESAPDVINAWTKDQFILLELIKSMPKHHVNHIVNLWKQVNDFGGN